MASMNTDDLMALALEQVGFAEVPGDCAIYVPGAGIRRVMIGIDVTGADLLLARQLGFDCVIAHHPAGWTPDRAAVYGKHIDQLLAAGIPREEAEQIICPRQRTIAEMASTPNYDAVPSVARLLGMPFLNIHNPWDEMGRRRMQETVDRRLTEDPGSTLADVVDALLGFREFQAAETRPQIRVGEPDSRAGRTVVSHGAYTNGGYAVAAAYFRHGVDTVITIHFPPEDDVRLRNERLGQHIVSGHVVSDSVGITPFIDALREQGVEVTCMSGVLNEDPGLSHTTSAAERDPRARPAWRGVIAED
jgi:hypothetical protein